MSDAIPLDRHAGKIREALAATPSPALATMTIPFREALVLTGLSRNTLYRMLRARKVPGAQKLGGTWRFHLQTLVDWLACKPVGTPPESR